MVEIRKVINDLENFNEWVKLLGKIEDGLFFTPIKNEKWTPAEIISHITYWDRYILEEMLPQMKLGARVESVNFEVVNKPAAEYARSGISMQDLLEAQLYARNKLTLALKEKDEADFVALFTLNGEEIDEYSGYPHTLYNYLCAFVWHDNHHKTQIETFLHEQKVSI